MSDGQRYFDIFNRAAASNTATTTTHVAKKRKLEDKTVEKKAKKRREAVGDGEEVNSVKEARRMNKQNLCSLNVETSSEGETRITRAVKFQNNAQQRPEVQNDVPLLEQHTPSLYVKNAENGVEQLSESLQRSEDAREQSVIPLDHPNKSVIPVDPPNGSATKAKLFPLFTKPTKSAILDHGLLTPVVSLLNSGDDSRPINASSDKESTMKRKKKGTKQLHREKTPLSKGDDQVISLVTPPPLMPRKATNLVHNAVTRTLSLPKFGSLEPQWPDAEGHCNVFLTEDVSGIQSSVMFKDVKGKGKRWKNNYELDVQPTEQLLLQLCAPRQEPDKLSYPRLNTLSAIPMPSNHTTHPLLTRISYTLSTSECSRPPEKQKESLMWTDKYAPKRAEEMLGAMASAGAIVLKDWLERVSVKRASGKQEPKKKGGRKRKTMEDEEIVRKVDKQQRKKPKRRGGLEDFMVSSSEEEEEREILTNLILLEGPSGSGKSAAVRAVAEEQDWEIFEVWPGMARGKKDMEKAVGEVGRNHHVSGLNKNKINGGGLFGKLMGDSTEKGVALLEEEETTKPKTDKAKQSLILLEEVDILFKEDKEFWQGVVDLVANSLRPIIMTCNDLSVVPVDTLPIQTFLHFPPVPLDLATSFLELVSLSEGHVVPTVELKHIAQGGDLRKSLTELQYRCQWALGDEMNGLGWMKLDQKQKEEGFDFSIGSLILEDQFQSANREMDVEDDLYSMISISERKSLVDAFFIRDWDQVDELYVDAITIRYGYDDSDDVIIPNASTILPQTRFPLHCTVLPIYRHNNHIADYISPNYNNDAERMVSLYHAQADYQSLDSVIRSSLLDDNIEYPHEVKVCAKCIFMDYIPFIRSIIITDDVNEGRDMEALSNVSLGRRSTRIAKKNGAGRHLFWTGKWTATMGGKIRNSCFRVYGDKNEELVANGLELQF